MASVLFRIKLIFNFLLISSLLKVACFSTWKPRVRKSWFPLPKILSISADFPYIYQKIMQCKKFFIDLNFESRIFTTFRRIDPTVRYPQVTDILSLSLARSLLSHSANSYAHFYFVTSNGDKKWVWYLYSEDVKRSHGCVFSQADPRRRSPRFAWVLWPSTRSFMFTSRMFSSRRVGASCSIPARLKFKPGPRASCYNTKWRTIQWHKTPQMYFTGKHDWYFLILQNIHSFYFNHLCFSLYTAFIGIHKMTYISM